MDETPTRQCRAPAFSKWFVTDFCWPHDEERAAQLCRNSDYLRQRGVQVVADSVDVMNIFPFLRSYEINANDVALVVIHGMCSRVGTDDNCEYLLVTVPSHVRLEHWQQPYLRQQSL